MSDSPIYDLMVEEWKDGAYSGDVATAQAVRHLIREGMSYREALDAVHGFASDEVAS